MLNIKRPSTLKGFSLLELLLVIVIIAGLASFGFVTLRQYANNSRIKETAAQIQLLEQAAAAYFADTDNWPVNCNDPTFKRYIADRSLNNPFGSTYTCQITGGGKKFAVFSGAITEPGALQQIAALLPSAGIEQNQLISEIIVPGKRFTNQAGYLLQLVHEAAYPFPTDQFRLETTPVFFCPIGWTPGSVVVLKGVYPTSWNFNVLQGCPGYGPGSRLIANLGAYYQPRFDTLNNSTNTTCTATGTHQLDQIGYVCHYYTQFASFHQNDQVPCDWYSTGGGNAMFMELGFCIPPSQSQQKSHLF